MIMRSKSHKALTLLFQWDWVLPAIIYDNAKGMIQGTFIRNLNQSSDHLKQTQPFTSWSNVAQRDERTEERFRGGNDQIYSTKETLG